MKISTINVSIVLTAPRDLAWTEGVNPPIFRKVEEVDLTPDLLSSILAKSILVDTQWITSATREIPKAFVIRYHAPSNTLYVSMKMETSAQKYFDHLLKMDWVLDQETANRYEFPKS
ncbi:MAG: hypothetical protein V4697_02870 [Patescibacteria group bacterium]